MMKNEDQFIGNFFLNLLLTVFMLFVNASLKMIIKVLTANEKHETYSNDRTSYLIKLIVIQYINTAIIPYVTVAVNGY